MAIKGNIDGSSCEATSKIITWFLDADAPWNIRTFIFTTFLITVGALKISMVAGYVGCGFDHLFTTQNKHFCIRYYSRDGERIRVRLLPPT